MVRSSPKNHPFRDIWRPPAVWPKIERDVLEKLKHEVPAAYLQWDERRSPAASPIPKVSIRDWRALLEVYSMKRSWRVSAEPDVYTLLKE